MGARGMPGLMTKAEVSRDRRLVQVENGRPHKAEFTLDRSGFALVSHRSAVAGLDDTAALDDVYTAESLELDTDHSVAWRAAHTSFRDTTTPGTHPRESVELRTVAFFS